MEYTEIINIIGYLASFFVALAMVFTSIIRLRWFSLIGNLLFTIYGIAFEAYPVAITNGLIMIINIYYLVKMYRKEELFRYLEVRFDNKYLKDFVRFHKAEIAKFFPQYEYKAKESNVCFFILRDMQVAGVIVAKRRGEDELEIVLDYTIKTYRDFKPGTYFFNNRELLLGKMHLSTIFTNSKDKSHKKYLKKVGFKNVGEGRFELEMG